MSTFTGESHSKLLHSEEDLERYFHGFAKPKKHFRVGLEAEFFAVDRSTGKGLPYFGVNGIQAILKGLAQEFGYEPILEGENIIALKRGSYLVSLEPGGQMELSAPPVANVFEIEDQIQNFVREIKAVSKKFSEITWLAAGIHPFSQLEELPWVPKTRYAIMAEHFKTRGLLSHEMMKLTATNQINMDYLDEEDAMASLRTALGITSIVTALFANSSFSEGKPNGYLSRRLEIWNQTDPERTGLIASFIHPDRQFRDYLDYLLKMPLLFIVREGRWIPIQKLTFRKFMQSGYQDFKATLNDFELHLSTAFPEARLKQYLEVRGVDCQSPELIPAVAAFWKGILYDEKSREKAWDLVAFASEEDRLRLHAEVPRKGLQGHLGSKPILPLACELVEISCASLGKQTSADETRSECVFLGRIREKITRPGKSPAETLLEQWEGEFKHNPGKLIKYLSV